MFLKTVRSEGLGCLSYILGDDGQAAVIDPRRDCKIYIDIANRHGAQISYVFESHRNEDFVVGSLELERRTGAIIYHGRALPFRYGEETGDGDVFELGDMTLKILETPGHTPESISIALIDRAFGEAPVAVFTGDALFVGDVGRTDFYKGREEEMAGKLYDSIHKKILPLGDHVILYPAHGKGSVCGANLADREVSTLGFERRFNPLLQKKRADFISYKTQEEHEYAPYFRQMEKFNKNGIPLKARLPKPRPLSPADFEAEARDADMLVLDVRSPEAFAGAHIPDSLSIPLDMVPAFAGWFLRYDRPVGIVAETLHDVQQACTYLMRLGFDTATAYLYDGFHAWSASGRDFRSLPVVNAGILKKRIKKQEDFILLDVRTRREYAMGSLEGAKNIYLGELERRRNTLPENAKIITFCASGRRAVIAASLLQQKNAGFKDIEVCLGSMREDAIPEKLRDDVSKAA